MIDPCRWGGVVISDGEIVDELRAAWAEVARRTTRGWKRILAVTVGMKPE
jgi:hypothetical protein